MVSYGDLPYPIPARTSSTEHSGLTAQATGQRTHRAIERHDIWHHPERVSRRMGHQMIYYLIIIDQHWSTIHFRYCNMKLHSKITYWNLSIADFIRIATSTAVWTAQASLAVADPPTTTAPAAIGSLDNWKSTSGGPKSGFGWDFGDIYHSLANA